MTTSEPQPLRPQEADLEAEAEKHTPFWRVGLRVRLLAVIALALLPMLTLSALYTQARFDAAGETQRELLAARAQLTAQSQRQVILGTGTMMSALAQQAPVRLGGTLCSRTLAQALADQPSYANIMRISASGHVACSAEPIENPVRFDDAPWFSQARETGRFIVGALEIDPVTTEAVVRAVSPVFDPDGAFSGALTTGIRLQALQQLGRERAGEARAALVDREGRLLTESRELGLARLDSALMHQAIEEGSARFSRSGPDGTPRIYVLVPLLSTELFALLAEPAPVFRDFATVDLAGTLLLPLAMLILAGSVIWMATDMMVLRWLRYMRRLAGAYGRGRYTVRPVRAVSAPAELRELAASFDTMARSIAERDEALNDSLAYQEMLLKEVHHRVKNNLQIITSLINLQMRAVDDPAAAKVLGDAQTRINALALVHRTLYEAGDFTRINLKSFFEELCTLTHAALSGQERAITLNTHISAAVLEAERCIPLALFVTEAMTNAYKHAFEGRDTGVLTVRLHIQPEGRMVAEVSDDGVGAAPAGPGGRRGVGGALFDAFARQLNGTSQARTAASGGHSVTLMFPLLEGEGPAQ